MDRKISLRNPEIMSKPQDQPIRVKKYANRRLYNTASSSYVTLDDLAALVKDGVDFVVTDAKSGEDITRSVLTQIIFEAENKGQNMLPLNFLRQLIGLYGDSLQNIVPNYLDHTMRAFAENEKKMRRQMSDAMGGMFTFPDMEDFGQRNMELFQRALQMWAPGSGGTDNPTNTADAPSPAGSDSEILQTLKRQMDDIQKQIDVLTGGKKKS